MVSGNVAYKKPTRMGSGMWGKRWPSRKAVDGNIDPVMNHEHCSWTQNNNPLSHAWKIDLQNFYDIDKITLYATKRECIELEKIHNTTLSES